MEKNDPTGNQMPNSIGVALEPLQEIISADEITKQIELISGQLKMNARCNLEGCEFDRAMLRNAYFDFYRMTEMLLEIAHQYEEDKEAVSKEDFYKCVRDTADIMIGGGWVF